MKPLSQHIQENLNAESLKESFTEKLVDDELDALNRVAPVTTADEKPAKSAVDTAVCGE